MLIKSVDGGSFDGSMAGIMAGSDGGEVVIQVAILAASPAMRAGLCALLEAPPGSGARLEVIGQAASLEELEVPLAQVEVLLVVQDEPPGLELRDLAAPEEMGPAVLVLTDQPEVVQSLSRLGGRVWGALTLDATAEELQAAVQALGQGLLAASPALLAPALLPPALSPPALSPPLLSAQAAGMLGRPEEPVEALSGREAEVLQWLALGRANKQIAVELGISEHTVKFHVSSIYAKLGVTNRAEAVRIGIQLGLISL